MNGNSQKRYIELFVQIACQLFPIAVLSQWRQLFGLTSDVSIPSTYMDINT